MHKIHISQVDALFSNGIYPIEFLLYFKKDIDTKKIRSALKRLSSFFWPLFGEYRDGVISFEKYVEDECYDEDVVSKKFDIPETEKERFEAFRHYSPPDIRGLFLLKVTQFRNGMILVPKMNHLAGDGYSYFYFLSALAVLSQQTSFPLKSSLMKLLFKPHHRRTTLRDFSFQGVELEDLQQNGSYKLESDEILRKDVHSVIKEVSRSKNLRVSTNDVLSAFAVQKLVQVQQEFPREYVELTIPIDVRRHIKEYGRRFLGNGLMLHTIKLKKDDIDSLASEEIAIQIRNSMPYVSKKSYIDYLRYLEGLIAGREWERFKPFDPRCGCLVTNISRLPVNKLDFGTGPPELIFPLTIEKNSTTILAWDGNFILRFAY